MKKVRCRDCGYLYAAYMKGSLVGYDPHGFRDYNYEDVIEAVNNEHRNDVSKFADSTELDCYKQEPFLKQEIGKLEGDELNNARKAAIEKERDCSNFMKYIPGYSPAKHIERWETLDRENSNRRYNLYFLLVGSGLTILGAALVKIFFG